MWAYWLLVSYVAFLIVCVDVDGMGVVKGLSDVSLLIPPSFPCVLVFPVHGLVWCTWGQQGKARHLLSAVRSIFASHKDIKVYIILLFFRLFFFFLVFVHACFCMSKYRCAYEGFVVPLITPCSTEVFWLCDSSGMRSGIVLARYVNTA